MCHQTSCQLKHSQIFTSLDSTPIRSTYFKDTLIDQCSRKRSQNTLHIAILHVHRRHRLNFQSAGSLRRRHARLGVGEDGELLLHVFVFSDAAGRQHVLKNVLDGVLGERGDSDGLVHRAPLGQLLALRAADLLQTTKADHLVEDLPLDQAAVDLTAATEDVAAEFFLAI